MMTTDYGRDHLFGVMVPVKLPTTTNVSPVTGSARDEGYRVEVRTPLQVELSVPMSIGPFDSRTSAVRKVVKLVVITLAQNLNPSKVDLDTAHWDATESLLSRLNAHLLRYSQKSSHE
jgi:hypothetical protein